VLNYRSRWWLRYAAAAVIVQILWLGSRAQNWVRPESDAPSSLEQVAKIAERQGLFQSSDMFNGKIGARLIVSTTMVTPERAGCVALRPPRHPSWEGTVAVYRGLQTMYVDSDPPYSVIWGNYFVCGDPELIRRLTSAIPP
jgi:hypothetical protein